MLVVSHMIIFMNLFKLAYNPCINLLSSQVTPHVAVEVFLRVYIIYIMRTKI